jgi:hypothetical protein
MNTYEQILLQIPEATEQLLEERRIEREILQKAILQAETTGKKFVNSSIGRSLASLRPKTTTYWVEYGRTGEEFQIHSAYSHRMGLQTGGGLTGQSLSISDSGWICNLCHVPVEIQTVRFQYMQSIFPINLPVCPQCSKILIPEELATGKMAEAEQILEDK